jgi:hypothetical protein
MIGRAEGRSNGNRPHLNWMLLLERETTEREGPVLHLGNQVDGFGIRGNFILLSTLIFTPTHPYSSRESYEL